MVPICKVAVFCCSQQCILRPRNTIGFNDWIHVSKCTTATTKYDYFKRKYHIFCTEILLRLAGIPIQKMWYPFKIAVFCCASSAFCTESRRTNSLGANAPWRNRIRYPLTVIYFASMHTIKVRSVMEFLPGYTGIPIQKRILLYVYLQNILLRYHTRSPRPPSFLFQPSEIVLKIKYI